MNDRVEIYGSVEAAELASAIYAYRSAEHSGGTVLLEALKVLESATAKCSDEERKRVLNMVGKYTMATLPKV